jgi:hypothetical protein
MYTLPHFMHFNSMPDNIDDESKNRKLNADDIKSYFFTE